MRVLGDLDPNVGWDGRELFDARRSEPGTDPPFDLRGGAASVTASSSGEWRILRDPLGINKLFWALNGEDAILLAARPRLLVDAGIAFRDILAVPSGAVVDLFADGEMREERSIRPSRWFETTENSGADVASTATRIRERIVDYLLTVARSFPDAPVFVCLSGGLDSSGIACLAREVFPHLVAVSFDLDRPGRRVSDDRAAAVRLAGDLGLQLLVATPDARSVLTHLDTVLVEGIDWRDFNVHAALVNAAIAQAIHEAVPARDQALVLTGDLANEFLIDYQEEHLSGSIYYRLPRLEPLQLRAHLVRGAETSHREVGIFSAWGLITVQPYAVAVDDYLDLPADLLSQDGRKQTLGRAVFGSRLPDYIFRRTKVRAQMGSPEGDGVLAACIEAGIDAAWLRRRFSRLLGAREEDLTRFMRAGVYRSEPPRLGGRSDA